MTIDQLPAEIIVPGRDDEVEKWKRYYRLRVPGADTTAGTQPHVDARVSADMLMPLYAAAVKTGKNAVLEQARGAALDQWGEREGVGPRRGAIGSTGFVTARTSSGGSTIYAGDELTHPDSRLRFNCIETRHYADGEAIPILAKDTGTATNYPAGTQLKWTSPRPGSAASVVVLGQSDGSGLSGGHPAEDDSLYLKRIQDEKRTRAASGNDEEYRQEAQKAPAVSVAKAFAYPGILGPATICLAFLTRPSKPGASRVPNSIQIGLVESHVAAKFPADDGFMMAVVENEDVDLVYAIDWSDSVASWSDIVPWPRYYEPDPSSGPGAVIISAATDALTFSLRTENDDYTGVLAPTVGQTLGFYDSANHAFVRKRILSVTGTGPWALVCDTTNSVSDTNYVPAVGQRAMPWSDSLSRVVSGVLAYYDSLGPGEQVASFYDEGRRQRRSPRPPSWPMTTTVRELISAAAFLPSTDPDEAPQLNEAVSDVDVLEGAGLTPSVGTPGTLSNVLKLRFVSVFPKVAG